MVLWELTLATAYFLGLKRTYRLALRLQKRVLLSRPGIRDFAKRRTRAVFRVALTAVETIQHRDIEIGRSVGNFLLRFLDRMKPSAHIRGDGPMPGGAGGGGGFHSSHGAAVPGGSAGATGAIYHFIFVKPLHPSYQLHCIPEPPCLTMYTLPYF
ncbi:unnamed protein product [Closterium sp. NIES-65]|nr:unnamed protein product [Closterium sp. NIES-65]CAI5971693.1 unnamed protein product [Closterium sp. NIES-65]